MLYRNYDSFMKKTQKADWARLPELAKAVL